MNDLPGDTGGVRFSHPESGASSSSASQIRAPPGQEMMQFFREFNDVNSSIDEIRQRLLTLQNSIDDYCNETRATEMKVLKEKMVKDLDEICVLARDLRGKLETLDRSNAGSREIRNRQAGSHTDRARMSRTSNLKRRLRELTVEVQALGPRFQDGFREIVETRLFAATGQQVDESMITRLIETGDSKPIFRTVILARGRVEVLDTVAEIRERHHALKRFEQKLLELHQIFPVTEVVVEVPDDDPANIEREGDPAFISRVVNAFKDYRIWLLLFFVTIIVVIIALVIFLGRHKKDSS